MMYSNMYSNMYSKCSLASCLFISIIACATTNSSTDVYTLYANGTITEPVLIELLSCPSMERLKGINQYGIRPYIFKSEKPYNRYDHSVGVMMLLRRFGASLHEQTAGLLHDVSHTIWSHVGDHLFKSKLITHEDSYQDIILRDFLYNSEIATILYKHEFAVEDVLHKNGSFVMLEQDLPNLCADRLEYNLYGGFMEELIDEQDIDTILEHLFFEQERWFFDAIDQAKQLGLVSLHLTEHVFAAPENQLIYDWAALALRRALDIGLINLDDIHYEVDDVIWSSLSTSDDEEIQQFMYNMMHYSEYYVPADQSVHDVHIIAKFRGLDPWVQTNTGLQRLTTIDFEYRNEFERVKQLVSIDGHYIKLLN